ncbi:unnamed protein product [Albugo candida]|uniref:Uncharacterized protein n=1 Tax=Albugo candida TaxID=65357 RepID=A0A024GRI6_9STRA|nr:unnamed protein product [Albugo candida]|eukprot:CCI49514.1 unnamed protein product [Albugo candida]
MRALSLLEEREERLRHQIVGNNETNTLHPIVLTERIRSLQKNIDTVAALVPNFNACAQEYDLNANVWTYRNTALRRQKSVLNNQSVAVATLQSEIDDVIGSLNRLRELKEIWTEWENVSRSPLMDADRVETMERIANVNIRQSLLVNRKVERLLSSYRNMMQLLSLKLIQTDLSVQSAEKKYKEKS